MFFQWFFKVVNKAKIIGVHLTRKYCFSHSFNMLLTWYVIYYTLFHCICCSVSFSHWSRVSARCSLVIGETDSKPAVTSSAVLEFPDEAYSIYRAHMHTSCLWPELYKRSAYVLSVTVCLTYKHDRLVYSRTEHKCNTENQNCGMLH